MRLSPVAPIFYPEVLTNAYYLNHQLEEAIAAAHETLRLAPDSVDARIVLVASLVETGRIDAAKQIARELLAIDPGFTSTRFASTQPHRHAAPLARLTDSLRAADLPEGEETPTPTALAPPNMPSRRRVAPRPRR